MSTPAVPTALPRWVAASVALIAALIGISGCGADLADCADADCRLSTAEAAFADAPVDTLRQVAALPDPIEQAALIELLVHRYPEHGTTICGVAPAGSIAAERCARLTVRPHLFATERVSPLQPAAVAPAAGPRADLPPPAGAAAPWLGLPVDEAALRATCGASSTCLQDAALERAGAADAVGAGQRCILAWPAGSAVGQECLFQVAERMMLARGAAVLEPALAVCAQTGNLASNCVQHVVLFTVPPATPADAPVAGAVQQATATAARLRALGGATAGAAYADLLWSVWLRECAVQARSPSGALAGWLPAEALPHLRMALAWQAALLHPPHTADPLRLAAELVARTTPGATPPPLPTTTGAPAHAPPKPARAFWRWDRGPEDAALPAVYALGAGRRALGETPEDDALIAVLEALARLPQPPPAETFAALLGGPHGLRVRWTAGRLASAFAGAQASGLLGRDPDPLVDAAIRAEMGAHR
ncbi:MAG: hypothetical protein JNM72_22075 [Deltaproteobacteria bacterium]|nr:hypothetical protein [Deltaproteobacteria bacterium]